MDHGLLTIPCINFVESRTSFPILIVICDSYIWSVVCLVTRPQNEPFERAVPSECQAILTSLSSLTLELSPLR